MLIFINVKQSKCKNVKQWWHIPDYAIQIPQYGLQRLSHDSRKADYNLVLTVGVPIFSVLYIETVHYFIVVILSSCQPQLTYNILFEKKKTTPLDVE